MFEKKKKKTYFQRIREHLKLSKTKLAKKLGLSQYAIISYEYVSPDTDLPRCTPSFLVVYNLIQLLKSTDSENLFTVSGVLEGLASDYKKEIKQKKN